MPAFFITSSKSYSGLRALRLRSAFAASVIYEHFRGRIPRQLAFEFHADPRGGAGF